MLLEAQLIFFSKTKTHL